MVTVGVALAGLNLVTTGDLRDLRGRQQNLLPEPFRLRRVDHIASGAPS